MLFRFFCSQNSLSCSIAGGELFDRVIEDEFVLSEKACCIFTKQILEGISYIHRQQIIHLDLKVIVRIVFYCYALLSTLNISAGEHSVLDQVREQNQDHRLWAGSQI